MFDSRTLHTAIRQVLQEKKKKGAGEGRLNFDSLIIKGQQQKQSKKDKYGRTGQSEGANI